MKKILFTSALITFIFTGIACNQCQTCTGEAKTFLDGVEQSSASIPEAEWCGDQLDMLKDNDFEISQSSELFGVTTEVRSTYTCN
ncbi:MAG: hypothetical protein AAF587_40875 [Bacteroidota bacterium]